MQTFINKVKPVFFGTPSLIMTLLALLPLILIKDPYYIETSLINIHLDIVFFIYFLFEFIIRFKERTLHGIYMYFDIIALISFLPFFKIFRLLLLARLFSAAFRAPGVQLLGTIIRENAYIFKSILQISFIYMFITSVIVFNIEPETFYNNYFYAFYWSGITLTTVGYGDIYPVTQLGQIISLISSFLGIGIIALPTGVISSNFMIKIKERQDNHTPKESKLAHRYKNNKYTRNNKLM